MQQTRNIGVTLSGASVEIAPLRKKRISIVIVNTGTSSVTIAKGDIAAVANEGIVLQPNGVYADSSETGYECWQGPIQAIGSTTLAVAETVDEGVSVQAQERW